MPPLLPLIACLLGACAVLLSVTASAQERVVHVGAVHFPPYVMKTEDAQPRALLPQLVDALNRVQTDFRFVTVPTSLARRFRDFETGRIDLALFENPAWGWQSMDYRDIDMGLEDAEVFVARQEATRTQTYFADLAGKRLALYNGYHYGFANFNADPSYLARHFNVVLTYSHDSNLLMLLHGRADIALVTRSYIDDFLARYPEYEAQLLISERIDQRYQHHALLRPEAPISAERFAELMEQLRVGGQLQAIFGRQHISVRPAVSP
ncbi:ABC-type amino acid transport substrate-binding protein [Pseudomonas cuatrocienegasensis]|uniref:ABC-type amino acid transport substrate-binding protein n=1 Tax=Pseudomonas cuatrocienegasensis TaxID=543360 RepID=A0ABY1B0X6_9PSED|nr:MULTISPECIES: ABC transporter substrate-binding protein [Pseudomonas]OEC36588.1 amino acid ABC transporter substrate-binding protein [Pseudomonas sp. 21C1]SEP66096.1 ABC-type amino acid transport substrate-binding protein [Pseudomonas cuatrocienegasensis]